MEKLKSLEAKLKEVHNELIAALKEVVEKHGNLLSFEINYDGEVVTEKAISLLDSDGNLSIDKAYIEEDSEYDLSTYYITAVGVDKWYYSIDDDVSCGEYTSLLPTDILLILKSLKKQYE